MEYNYKIHLSYLGYKYHGWAKQPNLITIEGLIEKELSIIFNQKIKLFALGRTDKNVHALEQVISFKTNYLFNINKLLKILNSKFNKSNIIFYKINIVNNNFNANTSALSKTYKYVINTKKFCLFENDIVYQYCKKINIKKLKEVAKVLIGTHDFLSFSTTELKKTVRTINWIKINKRKGKVNIYINGNGFLRSMVRMIIGQMLLYLENKTSLNNIKFLLDNPKKGSSIYKVPGHGLYLYKAYY